jgi:hypothetical protein
MRKISYCPNAMHLIVVIVMHLTVVIFPLQRSFDPSSIPFKTLRGLDKHIRNAMLPGADIRTLDLKKPLDGDQQLKFYFVSLKAEFRRVIANPAFRGKMYTQFEPEFTKERPLKRIFRRANSGTVGLFLSTFSARIQMLLQRFLFWLVTHPFLVRIESTIQFTVSNILFA